MISMIVRASSAHGPFFTWQLRHDLDFPSIPTAGGYDKALCEMTDRREITLKDIFDIFIVVLLISLVCDTARQVFTGRPMILPPTVIIAPRSDFFNPNGASHH